jgi:DNA polymerase-3 subunit delta'
MIPCGECDSCRLAASGNHPDLDVVGFKPGKRQLGIGQFIGEDEMRGKEGLCHNIALKPMLGTRRVAVIDHADTLTTESANCLLKTLEEPPPGAVIILIGTSRSRQLPTILSRAQIVRFQPLPVDVVRDLILAQGIATDASAAQRLAERSGGSVTRARDLADDALFEIRDRLVAQWTGGAFDMARLAREFDEFVSATGKEAADRRRRIDQVLSLIADKLTALVRESADAGAVDQRLLAAVDRTLQAQEQIDRNANQATLIESWLDDLAGLLPHRTEPARR